jgi:hypothetical protein
MRRLRSGLWALAYPPARSSLAIFRATTFASCPTRILDSIGLLPTSTRKRCGVFIHRISANGSASVAASPLKCFGYRPQASTVTFASAERKTPQSHELSEKKRGPHSDGPAHQILSGRRSSACGQPIGICVLNADLHSTTANFARSDASAVRPRRGNADRRRWCSGSSSGRLH